MKFFYDFFPVLLFFIAYKLYDIYVATAVIIVASTCQVGWTWFRHRRIERMPLITLALLIVLGGTTLVMQDEMFLKWKTHRSQLVIRFSVSGESIHRQ